MPRFCRALCGPRVTVRPQVISGPASPGQQVCTGRRARSTSAPSQDDLLAGGGRALLRRHVDHLHEHRPRVLPGVLQALRRLGLLQEGEQPADFAQRGDRLLAHAQRHALAACRTGCRAPGCAGVRAHHRSPSASRTATRVRRPSAPDRRSRSSRAGDRPRRRCASAPRAARVARGNREGRRISWKRPVR